MLPKRVGLPSTRPAHSTRSCDCTYGGPSFGTSGPRTAWSVVTGGTVRRRAPAPSTPSMQRALNRAIFATAPWREDSRTRTPDIGRPSCRDREGQYVQISVVAVSLNQHKLNQYTTQP